MHSSGVSLIIQTTVGSHFIFLLFIVSLTLSGSLEPPFPVFHLKSWGFSFFLLLYTSCDCICGEKVSRQREEKQWGFAHTLGIIALLVKEKGSVHSESSPLRFKCLTRCGCCGLSFGTCSGEEGRKKEGGGGAMTHPLWPLGAPFPILQKGKDSVDSLVHISVFQAAFGFRLGSN